MRMTLNETLERLRGQKDLTELEVLTDFATFVEVSFPEIWTAAGNTLDGLSDDDYEFFASSFDVHLNRRSGGGGGKGEEYVGMIVAYNGRRDTMERQRLLAIESAEGNLPQTLRYGIRYGSNDAIVPIGRAYEEDGHWILADADDKQVHKEKSSDRPRWVIPINNGQTHISLITERNGQRFPKPAYMEKREWVFVGNKKEDFLSQGPLPPRTLECSFESANADLQMYRPIRFKAEVADGWPDKEVKILRTGNINPSYDLSWVPDGQMDTALRLFQPDQFMAQFTDVVDLSEIFDYHEKNLTKSQAGKEYGPTFTITGVVDYIDYDGKDAPAFIEGGFKHSLTITSQSLRRDDPEANLWVEMSRYLVETHNALKVKKSDGWHTYARGSRVWIVVRSRTWDATDGSINLSLDGLGVYAMPLRSIIAEDPDDSVSDLSSLDDFSGGGV